MLAFARQQQPDPAGRRQPTWDHPFAFLALAAAICFALWYVAETRRQRAETGAPAAPAGSSEQQRARAVDTGALGRKAHNTTQESSAEKKRPMQTRTRRRQAVAANAGAANAGAANAGMANATEKMSMNAVAVAVGNGLKKAVGGDGGGGKKSDVVKVKAPSDNAFYFVAEDLPNKEQAADKLAEVNRRSQTLLQAVDDTLLRDNKITAADGTDVTENMRQLLRKHLGKPVPMAEYHCPDDLTVGSNSDKGALVEMCLRDKYDPGAWNSDNTLFRVHVHELAHSADFHYRGDGDEAHGPVFKRLHQHLLGVAEQNGLYNCAEYKQSGMRFCGLKLSEEYCGA